MILKMVVTDCCVPAVDSLSASVKLITGDPGGLSFQLYALCLLFLGWSTGSLVWNLFRTSEDCLTAHVHVPTSKHLWWRSKDGTVVSCEGPGLRTDLPAVYFNTISCRKTPAWETKSPFTLNYTAIRLLISFTALCFNLFTGGSFEVGERFGMESGADSRCLAVSLWWRDAETCSSSPDPQGPRK